jgi:HEAT repeat protein
MRKTDRVEAQFESLADLRNSRDVPQLAPFLDSRVNLVVAKAADIAGEWRAGDLTPNLESAFERLMRNPAVLDKGCAALTSIARALYALDYSGSAVFLAGIRHVQMEPGWGRAVDAAVELRGVCALGLTQTRYDGILFELVRLLADREWKARLYAARALAAMNASGAALVLQFKTSIGDEEPEVTGECAAGLVAHDPARYVSFITEYLEGADEPVAESVILALAGVRSDRAADLLIGRWKKPATRAMRQALLTSLATHRSERAVDFLVNQIAEEDESWAGAIVATLEKYRAGEQVLERARLASEARNR